MRTCACPIASIAPIKAHAQGADEGNLADTLSRMLGVYVGLKGEIMPENVKKWNVLKVNMLNSQCVQSLRGCHMRCFQCFSSHIRASD